MSLAFDSRFVSRPTMIPFVAAEETAVSLVKIIVITLVLLLSILFFWRFLF